MIFSLDAVSKNFRLFNDSNNKWNSRELLTEFVDHWKIIFVEKNRLKTGDKIGLGFPLTDIYYFSALIAAAELGLKLVVLDLFAQTAALAEQFFPLDLFVSGLALTPEKHNYYSTVSLQTEYWHVWDSYSTESNGWWDRSDRSDIDQDLVLLLCTSSGTTNRPKKVEHSHKFLFNISKRNCDLFRFQGNILHIRNLHHGSSLATYFIPALMSDECKGHFIFNLESELKIADLVQYCFDHDINHVQFPHVHLAEQFLKQAVLKKFMFNNLTIYILSYINPAWQELIKQCGFVKIVSVFGCNETSGPLFTNTLQPTQIEFDHTSFVANDNFYQFDFNHQGQLVVGLDDYKTSVVMQDSFNRNGNVFTHLGRNDLVRINDIKIDLFWILELAKNEKINAQIVIDRDREKLYLAVWDETDLQLASNHLNAKIAERYSDNVHIESAKHLKLEDCMAGIKLNHEVIRHIFRESI
jgi:hypothetical protein